MLRALVLLLFSGCAWAQQVGEPLRVVTDYWPPFRMQGSGGKLEGLDIDLLDELQRRTGLRFEVRLLPWARALEEMRLGQADLMTGLARTAEREQFIDYLEPAYHACAPRLYGAPERAAAIRQYAELDGLRIGYVLRSAYFEPFDSDTSLIKIGVKNEEQLLQMQLRGRVELMIGTDCQVDFQLRDPALASQLTKLAYQPPVQTRLYVGLSRASARKAERQVLARALQQLLQEGRMASVARRYR
ncbi:substrate-binding periplasmic protein [Pseudomonas sp. Gutcm_11s]|uniref:substrate-binding periplasmic protein n=1 Tax=Pseudomonas sp. Gutcm_11s TaxID=3026088 RepID=UPI00236257B0|nr:transporter substrate-binding domain-containing protein [Pseudomonas sp. Gutcm_11s]MDD0843058.1 transporter substrate-binding domain-containing protein [Pseudomonas sp. Gutcm_11s]